MKSIGVMLFALAAVSLAGCAPLIAGGAGAAAGYYVGQDERTAGQIASDALTTSKITAAYAKDEVISASNIDVDTRSGNVTLHGNVPSREVEQRAIAIARGMEGVNKVDSQLSIVPRGLSATEN
ncbi:MAG: BON domain-containing protein [Gammaproteobacteria bacterium]